MTTSAWAQSPNTTALSSGVVLDEARSLVYLMEPNQLSARRLADGELVWQQSALIEPLGLYQGQLIVLGNRDLDRQPVLYRLDPASGSISSSVTIDLPEDVRYLVEDRPGEAFSAYLLPDSDAMRIAWRYTKRALRGAPAISGVNRAPKAPRQVAADQNDEPLTMSERVALEDRSTIRASGVIEVSLSTVLSDESARASQSAPAAIVWSELRGADRASGHSGRQFKAAGGAEVLVSEGLPTQSAWQRYQWTLINDDNETIGQTESPYAFAPFGVADERLVYVAHPYVRMDGQRLIAAQDLALIVVDLASGRQAWQAGLRDTAYRDSMPP